MILVEKLLVQDRRYRYFQAMLENRIYNDSAAYQRLRTYCTTLEKQNSEFEGRKSDYEKATRTAIDSCQLLSRDLSFEKMKVQDLEARLNELYPSIQTLLENHALPPSRECSTAKEDALQHELSCQRELVQCLKSTIRDREETIEIMGHSLENAYGGHSLDRRVEDPCQPKAGNSSSDTSMEIVSERSLPPAVREQ